MNENVLELCEYHTIYRLCLPLLEKGSKIIPLKTEFCVEKNWGCLVKEKGDWREQFLRRCSFKNSKHSSTGCQDFGFKNFLV